MEVGKGCGKSQPHLFAMHLIRPTTEMGKAISTSRAHLETWISFVRCCALVKDSVGLLETVAYWQLGAGDSGVSRLSL